MPLDSVFTWLHLILGLEGLSLDLTHEHGGSTWEALVCQPHVLLPDGQGTVHAFTGHLKVIHGHLSST